MRMSDCHPERIHYGKGMCRRCYSRENSKKLYRINPQNQKNRSKKYNDSHVEKNKERHRIYYQAHKEKYADDKKKYRLTHRDEIIMSWQKRRARKSSNGGSFTVDEWRELCARYDNLCLCCKNKADLTIDHIVPISKGGKNNIDNIQPLCQSCNSKKGVQIIDYR